VLALSAEEADQLARLEHRRWLIERRLLERAVEGQTARASLRVEWDALPESERERNREDFRRLPQALAAAGYEIRRQRRILAVGAGLEAALATLHTPPTAAAPDETQDLIILADVDTDGGREAAELALARPDTALWLVSREEPGRFRKEAHIMALSERAAGWLRHES
jgi:hypothetical protein